MENKEISFTSEILLAKKTATGIQVPDEVVRQLGSSNKPAVRVTINGYTYPSTVASMGGVFMLPVIGEVREKAGIKGGDMVTVTVVADNAPREVRIPEDFRDALNSNPKALQFFETLSNSNKKRFTIPIEQAKTPETRSKRIEKAVMELEQQKKV